MMDKQRVNCHFGRIANKYDKYAIVQKKMGESLQQIVQTSGPFHRILEIGCGTGFLTKKLAQLYPNAEIIASDISATMLQTASSNLSDFSNIHYKIADGEDLQLTGPFDLIVSNAAFQWFNDYSHAFKKMLPQISTGGFLIYATFGKNTFHELHQAFLLAHQSLGINAPHVHGPQFLSIQELEYISSKFKNSTFFNEETFIEKFQTVKDFLLSVKKVGANNAAHEDHMIHNRKLLLKMIECYEDAFQHQELIAATYHVIYGCHKKL